MTQESGPAEKPQKLTVLDWAHFWPKSWGPRQEAGASKRWGPTEKVEAPLHQRAAETGLWAVWGCWWSGDIPASNFWDRWGCWRSSCPSLVSCRFTTRKILSNLFFGPQSAVSPWEFGRSVAQTFHREACTCLGTGFLWPQHPSEEALGDSSREDSWPISRQTVAGPQLCV